LTSLQASLAEQVQMNRELAGQRDKQADDLRRLHAQLLDMTLNYQEVSRNLETAEQNARVKHDQLAQAEALIKELQEKLVAAGGPRTGEVIPVPETEIQGRITAVSMENRVAQLNVGAASGVREGMRFLIYRGSTYVGDLKVAQVEPNDCAGILENLQVQPLPQDRATTRLAVD